MSAGGRVLLAFLLAVALLALWAAGVSADCPLYRDPTQRFGGDLNYAFGNITSYDVASLNMSFYSDWSAAVIPLRPNGIEYLQLLAVKYGKWYFGTSEADWTMLAEAVAANPGSVWMIGNEPECPNAPGGGVNTPEQYAEVYHDLYWYIKGRDSTARIAIGGVVEPTPLRLQWLGYMLDYYQATYGVAMPIDIWTTHVLILPEMKYSPAVGCNNPDVWGAGVPVGSQFITKCLGMNYAVADNWNVWEFYGLVGAMRTWMNARGQRNKPLWVTEYGVLMPYADNSQVNYFMNKSFDWLLSATSATTGYPADGNRLVQRWAWNSINDQPYQFDGPNKGQGFNGSLFLYTNPLSMTIFGQNYMTYTNSLLLTYPSMSGTVQFDGRPAAPHASYVSPLTVTLSLAGCPDDVRTTTTDGLGQFKLSGISAGTYDIWVKSPTTLATRTYSVTLAPGTKVVNLGLLRSGDCNNDNQVDIKDFSILSAAYATSPGDARYDARADLNGDGTVDVLDYSWLATRFEEHGAP